MDFFSSRRFVSIVLVILVVLNLVLLGALWQQNFNKTPEKKKTVKVYSYKNKQSFFEKELGLSAEQSQTFDTLRRQHFQSTIPSLVAISGLKKQLIEEALKETPDSLAIKTLSERIGRQQALIEYRLAWHFNGLSKTCTPEQRDSLEQILERLTTRSRNPKRRLLLKSIRITPLESTEKEPVQEEEK